MLSRLVFPLCPRRLPPHATTAGKETTLCSPTWSKKVFKGPRHHRHGYFLWRMPTMTERRFGIMSPPPVKAYHKHFCKMEGNWLLHTNLACGDHTSTHLSHSRLSPEGVSKMTPFLSRDSLSPSGARDPSPRTTRAPCGSHFRRIPYTEWRRDETTVFTTSSRDGGTNIFVVRVSRKQNKGCTRDRPLEGGVAHFGS